MAKRASAGDKTLSRPLFPSNRYRTVGTYKRLLYIELKKHLQSFQSAMASSRFTLVKNVLLGALVVSQFLSLVVIVLPATTSYISASCHTAHRQEDLTPEELARATNKCVSTSKTMLYVSYGICTVFNLIAFIGVWQENSCIVRIMAVLYSIGSISAIWNIIHLRQDFMIFCNIIQILLAAIAITFAILLNRGEDQWSGYNV